jgi:phosphomannomutase
MTDDFAKTFTPFVLENLVFIVSGSDIDKIKEQMPADLFLAVQGIYASMGNEFYRNAQEIFSKGFIDDDSLLSALKDYRKNTKYPHQLYSNYIEIRKGAFNFSILGRDCSQEERSKYNAWDNKAGERAQIVAQLIKLYPQYDFSIGGMISIDIVPKGCGKEQVADFLRADYPDKEIIFIGDRTERGGNDFSLAQRLRELGKCKVIQTNSPQETLRVLGLR